MHGVDCHILFGGMKRNNQYNFYPGTQMNLPGTVYTKTGSELSLSLKLLFLNYHYSGTTVKRFNFPSIYVSQYNYYQTRVCINE